MNNNCNDKSSRGKGWFVGEFALPTLTASLLYVLFALPLWRHQFVLLLDWVLPIRTPFINPSLFGINIIGISTGDLSALAIRCIGVFVGGYATQLVLLAIFLNASFGIFALLKDRSAPAKVASATLFLYNPFVFDRIFAGQLNLVLGYSLLPYAALNLRRINQKNGWLKFGVIWTLSIIASPHYFWIIGLLVVAHLVVTIHRGGITAFANVLGASVYVVGALAYQLVTTLIGGANGMVTISDLTAYRTVGSTWYGALGNLIGLYGFWRRGPKLARDVVTGWPIFLAGILAIFAIGVYSATKKGAAQQSDVLNAENTNRVSLERSLLSSSIVAIFLALGSRGPTKFIFDALFHYVPTFAAMREAQKFDALWALSLTYFFGLGLDNLLGRYRKTFKAKAIIALIAIALVFVYEPLEPFALNGQISSSNFPSDWNGAYQVISKGSGSSLCLPWHLYEAFKFTSGRVIANPCKNYFGPNTIVSPNAELAGATKSNTTTYYAYLNYLISKGNYFANFGQTLNELGIQFVIVFKTVDYKNYSWLNHQTDISLAFNGPTIEVYKNNDFSELRPVVNKPIHISSWGNLISMEQEQRLSGTVNVTQNYLPGPIVPPSISSNPKVDGSARVTVDPYGKISISSTAPGFVEIPYPWIRGWQYSNRQVSSSATGQIYLEVPKGNSYLEFQPKTISIASDLFSIALIVGGIIKILIDGSNNRRRARKSSKGRSANL